MFLLQVTYLKESDPTAAIVAFIVLALLVTYLVVSNIAKHGIGGTGFSSGSKTPRAHFSKGVLRKAAATYGLDQAQTHLLEHIFKKAQVTNPELALANAEVLDRHFKRGIRDIESTSDTEAEADENKALLFSIRATVDSVLGSGTKMVSTRKLPDGQAAVLTGPKGETYPIRIMSAKGDRLLADAPRSSIGAPLRFPRGTRLGVSFYSKTSQGYRFDTKVQGMTESPRGLILELSHSDRVAPLPNRGHRRREVSIACYFALVQILQRAQGKKTVRETIVDDRKSMGTIVDISAGGCAIKSSAAVRTGEYLKIEFDDDRGKTLAAFGRIVRTNKTGGIGGIMHIQFLKTTRKTLNNIYAVVYGYEQD